ncbi:MAG TPA: glycosyltransferase family 2 protein [Candidatus Bathyarchaeia archaeon]|nr:glycosyltransferase family 2 protein [Candidatus Bathyarchaeia archaeon]
MNIILKFSILIPTWNGAEVIGDTLRSILSQSFQDFEIIVQDDASSDNTIGIIRSFDDPRIKIFKNEINLGYSRNLNELSKKATGDIIYLMGQDDILGENALQEAHDAFQESDDIGAVARPYFWFDRKITKPVRATGQLNPKNDEIVKITDDFERIILTIDVAGQLSGLAMRRKFLDTPFHEDIFPCHVYPFAAILKKHPIVFLKDYNLAVRIRSSQCRSVSSIYNKSPVKSWIDFANNVFPENEFGKFRKYFVRNYVAKNYVGLVQIRNYAKYRYLLREIWYLLKYRWQNIFSLRFFFWSVMCLATPPFVLIRLADWYKSKIMSKTLHHINFEYTL